MPWLIEQLLLIVLHPSVQTALATNVRWFVFFVTDMFLCNKKKIHLLTEEPRTAVLCPDPIQEKGSGATSLNPVLKPCNC